jgi:hypothetical protein
LWSTVIVIQRILGWLHWGYVCVTPASVAPTAIQPIPGWLHCRYLIAMMIVLSLSGHPPFHGWLHCSPYWVLGGVDLPARSSSRSTAGFIAGGPRRTRPTSSCSRPADPGWLHCGQYLPAMPLNFITVIQSVPGWPHCGYCSRTIEATRSAVIRLVLSRLHCGPQVMYG